MLSGGGVFFPETADIFSESAVGNAATKLKESISNLIKTIKDFIGNIRLNKKNITFNPNVEVDKKEIGKLKKFVAASKKVLSMPFKALVKFISNHKKSSIIVLLTTFTVGAGLVKARSNANKVKKITEVQNNINNLLSDTEEDFKNLLDQEKSLSESIEQCQKINDCLLEGMKKTPADDFITKRNNIRRNAAEKNTMINDLRRDYEQLEADKRELNTSYGVVLQVIKTYIRVAGSVIKAIHKGISSLILHKKSKK